MLLCHHSHLLPAPQSAEEALPHLDCWLDCLPGRSHLDWCCWYLRESPLPLHALCCFQQKFLLLSVVGKKPSGTGSSVCLATVTAKQQAGLCLCGCLHALIMLQSIVFSGFQQHRGWCCLSSGLGWWMLSAQLNNWTASELHWKWPSGASLWLSRVPG